MSVIKSQILINYCWIIKKHEPQINRHWKIVSSYSLCDRVENCVVYKEAMNSEGRILLKLDIISSSSNQQQLTSYCLLLLAVTISPVNF